MLSADMLLFKVSMDETWLFDRVYGIKNARFINLSANQRRVVVIQMYLLFSIRNFRFHFIFEILSIFR